ncbi:MAG: hypothetical protein R3B48_21180 [Kofleriaceae bacterium]
MSVAVGAQAAGEGVDAGGAGGVGIELLGQAWIDELIEFDEQERW